LSEALHFELSCGHLLVGRLLTHDLLLTLLQCLVHIGANFFPNPFVEANESGFLALFELFNLLNHIAAALIIAFEVEESLVEC